LRSPVVPKFYAAPDVVVDPTEAVDDRVVDGFRDRRSDRRAGPPWSGPPAVKWSTKQKANTQPLPFVNAMVASVPHWRSGASGMIVSMVGVSPAPPPGALGCQQPGRALQFETPLASDPYAVLPAEAVTLGWPSPAKGLSLMTLW
jgi:hypothetical protein